MKFLVGLCLTLHSYIYFQTHPSQSCFMSSIDLHTQYSYQVIDSLKGESHVKCFFRKQYKGFFNFLEMAPPSFNTFQVMVPEAFAIVMAPTDTSRSYGIFRLSDPVGMSVLKDCPEEGFHHHNEPADGGPIYEHCSNIYINSNLRFEIFDLR
ncbi:AMSH-like ubiquitin thioesterase 2 [Vitis vinifera]|uniref:AMSH-like ubiquitin thioesterase 2 n=1 Tax=Vitis vinifera TaxID=29760 RepID=A0A438EI02_VITVI|nr:AMSH-like ubiquitin thioesterase 2 [Vitis vinifera]